MNLLIITMSPGETSQFIALAKELIDKKHKIFFGYLKNVNPIILNALECEKQLINSPEQARDLINSGIYQAVMLGNSKIFRNSQQFQNKKPDSAPFCVSLDSNWLFNQPESFPFIKWLDIIYLNFPEDVYKNGLVEYGGSYHIPDEIKKKIKTVGLIPSYKPISDSAKKETREKLGIKEDEKLIFCYIGSGNGYTLRHEFRPILIEIFNQYWQNNRKFKIIYMSGEEPVGAPWLVPTGGQADSKIFFEYLSASDLVFQHQGMGTLQQSISACVPAIANVPPVDPNKDHNTAWEIGPFEKAGLCKMHFYDDKIDKIISSVNDLLYTDSGNLMRRIQKDHYSYGEENLCSDLLRRISK
ncbi:MAG: hypothetical protein WC107_06055 [Patescibacteria group bacterium]